MTTDITLCNNADKCPLVCGRDPKITVGSQKCSDRNLHQECPNIF